jgi:hypothetical protein
MGIFANNIELADVPVQQFLAVLVQECFDVRRCLLQIDAPFSSEVRQKRIVLNFRIDKGERLQSKLRVARAGALDICFNSVDFRELRIHPEKLDLLGVWNTAIVVVYPLNEVRHFPRIPGKVELWVGFPFGCSVRATAVWPCFPLLHVCSRGWGLFCFTGMVYSGST